MALADSCSTHRFIHSLGYLFKHLAYVHTDVTARSREQDRGSPTLHWAYISMKEMIWNKQTNEHFDFIVTDSTVTMWLGDWVEGLS